MKNIIILFLAALFTSNIAVAQAYVEKVDVTIPAIVFTTPVYVPAFNDLGGERTLRSVRVTVLFAAITGRASVENEDTLKHELGVSYSGISSIAFRGVGGEFIPDLGIQHNHEWDVTTPFSLAPSDGVLGSGDDFFKFTPSAFIMYAVSPTVPPLTGYLAPEHKDIASFEGPGVIQIDFSHIGAHTCAGAPSSDACTLTTINNKVKMILNVVYYYDSGTNLPIKTDKTATD